MAEWDAIYVLKETETFYDRICHHLADVSYILSSSPTEERLRDKALVDSMHYKYQGMLETVKQQRIDFQNNCEHQWSFHGYGSSDRMMRCSKCLLIRPEAKT